LSGSASICALPTVVPSSDEAVWINGVSAVTLTDSVIAPTSCLILMRTRWSTPTSMFDSATVLNPVISDVMV
jgi:hypothetical protein